MNRTSGAGGYVGLARPSLATGEAGADRGAPTDDESPSWSSPRVDAPGVNPERQAVERDTAPAGLDNAPMLPTDIASSIPPVRECRGASGWSPVSDPETNPRPEAGALGWSEESIISTAVAETA